jgi:hypothetical protein
MKFYILKYLYNYFIMHDIKYFFLINVIKQFKEQIFFLRKTNYQKYHLKILFFKIQITATLEYTIVYPTLPITIIKPSGFSLETAF